LRVC